MNKYYLISKLNEIKSANSIKMATKRIFQATSQKETNKTFNKDQRNISKEESMTIINRGKTSERLAFSLVSFSFNK